MAIPRLLVSYEKDKFDCSEGGAGQFVQILTVDEKIAILTSNWTITVWNVRWATGHFCPLPHLELVGQPVQLSSEDLLGMRKRNNEGFNVF